MLHSCAGMPSTCVEVGQTNPTACAACSQLLSCLRVCVQGSDARAAMLARLGAIEASAGACLLLVDNAEDTLCSPEPDALPTLLDKVGPGWGLQNAMSCLLPH